MKKILEYLEELTHNNNREWFNENKSKYKEVRNRFDGFATKLCARLAEADPSVDGLRLNQYTYRIYRDLRFSTDKTPYKTHISAYIAPGGKCSGFAGYYIHIEPDCSNFLKHNILAAGAHCPSPKELKSIREEFLDNGAMLVKALESTAPFVLDYESALKRPPKDFSADSPFIEYIKLKDFTLSQPLEMGNLDDHNFLDYCAKELIKCKNFNEILNRAIRFAHDEM